MKEQPNLPKEEAKKIMLSATYSQTHCKITIVLIKMDHISKLSFRYPCIVFLLKAGFCNPLHITSLEAISYKTLPKA